jgi:hypothetical protein
VSAHRQCRAFLRALPRGEVGGWQRAARSWRGTCQLPSVWSAVGDDFGAVRIPRAWRFARLAAGLASDDGTAAGRLGCRPRQLTLAGEECAGSEVADWALTLMYQGLPGGAPRW